MASLCSVPERAVRVRALILGKTLNSNKAPLNPSVLGMGEFNAEGSPAMDWHPIQRGVERLLED